MSKEMNNKIVKVKEESKKIPKQDVIKVVGIVGVGILSGIFGYKAGKLAKNVKVLTAANETLCKHIGTLNQEVNTLNAAASEGLYEEAIATVTRKINYLKDRVSYCSKQLVDTPNDSQTRKALESYSERLTILTERRKSFREAQKLYEISEK